MADAINRLIERHGPEAICAALESMLTPERIRRIDTVLAHRLVSLATIVEDTYDPHNAAATIRTTEAIGIQQLHVIEPEERFSAAGGVTRGAHKWIDLVRWHDPLAAIGSLRARGFKVYATLPGAPYSIEDVPVDTPIAVAFGNEHDGLHDATVAACDGALGVPMHGFTESFNLSVTVALAMSRLATRRREALGVPGDLPDEQRRVMRARWFALKVRGVVGVLERTLGGATAPGRPRP